MNSRYIARQASFRINTKKPLIINAKKRDGLIVYHNYRENKSI